MPGRPLFSFYPAIVSTTSRGGISRCRGFLYETSAGAQRFAIIQSDGMLLHDLPCSSSAEIGGPNSASWSVTIEIDGVEETWNVQYDGSCASCGGEPSQTTAETIMANA